MGGERALNGGFGGRQTDAGHCERVRTVLAENSVEKPLVSGPYSS